MRERVLVAALLLAVPASAKAPSVADEDDADGTATDAWLCRKTCVALTE